jgi:excisionase family DNA binding protein
MNETDTKLDSTALPDILDVADLAALIHIHPVTIRLHAAQGRIPGRQVGNRWRFRRDRIMAWLDEAA